MKIIATWDDGCKEDVRLADLMAKYEIPSIFYIPSEWQSYNWSEGREPLSYEDLLNIAEVHEIGSHTITHRMLTRIPLSEAETEILDSQHQLQHLVNQEIKSFCYPRGYANDNLRDIVGQVYETARNTLVGNYKKPENPLWVTPTVHVAGKRRPEYENTTWDKEAFRLLEEAIKEPDSIYHIWGHSWEITRYDQWEQLEGLLKALQQL